MLGRYVLPYLFAGTGYDGLHDDMAKAEDVVATMLHLVEAYSPKEAYLPKEEDGEQKENKVKRKESTCAQGHARH